MKVTFIATVFNEEENILKLLDSLLIQTKFPDEVVLVDGGSSDRTVSRIKNYKLKFKGKFEFALIIKKGNRSVGRNEAVRIATGNIIICSDAGCILGKDWISNITQPFEDTQVDVVAGYYKGKYENIFQKCLILYVLVMPNKVDPPNFLPAARSIAFRQKIWEKVGGFPEQFSNNEDFVFAKRLKKIAVKIAFKKDAVVYWIPRKNLKEAFVMFYRFATGDAESKILRPKVILIFIRYILGILILFLAIIREDKSLLLVLMLTICLYILWAIQKNYKYAHDIMAFVWLPILQITSDIAVISGTTCGIFKLWDTKKI